MPDISEIVATAVSEANAGATDTGPVTESSDYTHADGAPAVDTAAETVADAPAEPAAAKPDKAAEPGEEDDLKAIEAELTAKTPGLKNGRISVSRHQAVLTRARRQAEKLIEDAKKPFASYETPEFKDDMRAISLAKTDPSTFFNRVLLQTPEYRKLVDELIASRTAPKAPEPKAAPAEEPGPDVLNPDGSVGYSAAGLKALRDWDTAQVKQALQQAHQADLKKLRDEIAPVLTEHEGVRQLHAATARMKPVLENARSRWSGFKEHEGDIYAALKADSDRAAAEGRHPLMTLEQAYDAVVPAKLALSAAKREAEIEAKLIKKMNDASAMKNAPVAPGGLPAAHSGPAQERTMEDIVREATRNASA